MDRYVSKFVCDPTRETLCFERKIADDVLYKLSKAQRRRQQDEYVRQAEPITDYLFHHANSLPLCMIKSDDVTTYSKNVFDYAEFCQLIQSCLLESIKDCDSIYDYAYVYYPRLVRHLNKSWKMKKLLRPANIKTLPASLNQLYDVTGGSSVDKTFIERMIEVIYNHPLVGKKNDSYAFASILYAIDREMTDLRENGSRLVYNKKRKRYTTIEESNDSQQHDGLDGYDDTGLQNYGSRTGRWISHDSHVSQPLDKKDGFHVASTSTLYMFGRLMANYAGHILKYRPIFPGKNRSYLHAAIYTEAVELLSLPSIPPHLYLSVDDSGILPIDLAYQMMLNPYSGDLSVSTSSLVFMLVTAYTPGVIFDAGGRMIANDVFDLSKFWKKYIRPLNMHLFTDSETSNRGYEDKLTYQSTDEDIAKDNINKIIPFARECVKLLCTGEYGKDFDNSKITIDQLVKMIAHNDSISNSILSRLNKRNVRASSKLSSLIFTFAQKSSSITTPTTRKMIRPVFDNGIVGLYVYYHVLFVSDILRRERGNLTKHTYLDLKEKLYNNI